MLHLVKQIKSKGKTNLEEVDYFMGFIRAPQNVQRKYHTNCLQDYNN